MRFKSTKAEEMRLKDLYRGMALRGEALPSHTMGSAALRRLIGPDCAYHLYGRHKGLPMPPMAQRTITVGLAGTVGGSHRPRKMLPEIQPAIRI